MIVFTYLAVKGRARKGRKKADNSDDEPDVENLTPAPRTQKGRGAKGKKKPAVAFTDSDDSDIELFEVDKSSKKKKGNR